MSVLASFRLPARLRRQEPRTTSVARRARRRSVALSAVAAVACSGGLATAAGLEQDAAPENYAGTYVLYTDGEFAGPVRAFSGCGPEVPRAGALRYIPCTIEMGLQMGNALTETVQGTFGGPGELERHFKASPWQGDRQERRR